MELRSKTVITEKYTFDDQGRVSEKVTTHEHFEEPDEGEKSEDQK